jgi:hypothetical protein
VEAFKRERDVAEENRLKEQNEFKALFENERKKTEELQQGLAERDLREKNARKLNAFLKTVGGQVDEKYWLHIDIDKILVDPNTGVVDEMSVTKEVERFKATYPEVLRKPQATSMTVAAPNGVGSLDVISYEEWKKLPLKEMKKYRTEQIR